MKASNTEPQIKKPNPLIRVTRAALNAMRGPY